MNIMKNSCERRLAAMVRGIVRSDVDIVKELLKKVVGTQDYIELERMGGLTNRTYKVTFPYEKVYVVRIPGEGTEKLITRKDEKISTELACELGIDANLLHFAFDGSKVTAYISGAVTMSPETMREPNHIRKAADIFKRLHHCGQDTGVFFDVFDMAHEYENIIYESHVNMYNDYMKVKKKVMEIKDEIDAVCQIKKVPCHNDPLCENWVMSETGRMYLIDWEYAGMNDGIWDLADLSIEADYDHSLEELFLREYLGYCPQEKDWKHFQANKLYVDYLWMLWAKTRVPYDGQAMEDWAGERYERLKANINIFEKIGRK